jgi:hypothetical protein
LSFSQCSADRWPFRASLLVIHCIQFEVDSIDRQARESTRCWRSQRQISPCLVLQQPNLWQRLLSWALSTY